MSNGLLANRNFCLLWIAQIISGFGSILYAVGIMVAIFNRTESALLTVAVMVVVGIPGFLLSPLAGQVADRHDRRLIMIISDLARVIITPILILTVKDGDVNLPFMFLVLMLLSVGGTFRYPARMALLPQIVNLHHLTRANSTLTGTSQAIVAFGYAIGGLLTLHLEFSTFVWLNAFTFLVAGILMIYLRVPKDASEDDKTEFTSTSMSWWQSLEVIRKHPVALPLLAMEVLEHIPHGAWVAAVMLAFVKQSLGGGVDDWGVVTGTYFLGMVIGAVIANRAHQFVDKYTGWVIIVNAFLTSILTLAFGFSGSVLIAIFVSLVFGLPNAVRDIAQDSLLQSKVESAFLGRVYATRNMLANTAFTFAGVAFAWVADTEDVRWVYIIAAFLYLITAIYGISSGRLRQSANSED